MVDMKSIKEQHKVNEEIMIEVKQEQKIEKKELQTTQQNHENILKNK